jgi:chromosome segregation ATPase
MEIEGLNAKILKLQEESKQKDYRLASTQERLKKRIEELTRLNQALTSEVQVLEKTRTTLLSELRKHQIELESFSKLTPSKMKRTIPEPIKRKTLEWTEQQEKIRERLDALEASIGLPKASKVSL